MLVAAVYIYFFFVRFTICSAISVLGEVWDSWNGFFQMGVEPKSGLPNLFGVAGHFHMRKFIAGHKHFCDVTNLLILKSCMR